MRIAPAFLALSLLTGIANAQSTGNLFSDPFGSGNGNAVTGTGSANTMSYWTGVGTQGVLSGSAIDNPNGRLTIPNLTVTNFISTTAGTAASVNMGVSPSMGFFSNSSNVGLTSAAAENTLVCNNSGLCTTRRNFTVSTSSGAGTNGTGFNVGGGTSYFSGSVAILTGGAVSNTYGLDVSGTIKVGGAAVNCTNNNLGMYRFVSSSMSLATCLSPAGTPNWYLMASTTTIITASTP